MCTSCIVRSENRTTRFSSTRTISPVSPSYLPAITLTWSPILKCFFSSWDINSSGSRRSSCLGIMVILLPSTLITLPWRWTNSPSHTSTTSPGIRLWFTSPCCLSGTTARSKRLFTHDKHFFLIYLFWQRMHVSHESCVHSVYLPIILLWTNKCNLHSTSAPSGVSSNFSSSARVGFTPSAICQENIFYTNFIIFQVIFLIKKKTGHVCIKIIQYLQLLTWQNFWTEILSLCNGCSQRVGNLRHLILLHQWPCKYEIVLFSYYTSWWYRKIYTS